MKLRRFVHWCAAFLFVACGPAEAPVDDVCQHGLQPMNSNPNRDGRHAFVDYDPSSCVPDRQAYTDVAQPIVETYCGTCHGETPQFGAPFELLDYDRLVDGDVGERHADRIALRSGLQTMPPPGSAPVPHDALDSLVEWATCGLVHPDHALALDVSRPPYVASTQRANDLPFFDVAAKAYPVGRSTIDDYRCFAMDVPVAEPKFIRRMQVSIDESRVLHHAVLFADPMGATRGQESFPCDQIGGSSTPLLYAWAPGAGAFEFEDGGLRIAPGERMIVQIHYNNGAGLEDITDSSGVRVFYDEPTGTEWNMLMIGPEDFEIAPKSVESACSTTPVPGRLRMLAGLPHMHEFGREFHEEIIRADGTREPVVDLTGWAFETQQFYEYELDLFPGDRLHTWCIYDNPTDQPVSFGEKTSDEMCYHFVYVSSP